VVSNSPDLPLPDRHPAARLAETLRRLPAYLRLAKALLGDRRLSRLRKAGLGAGIAYLLSPIDLVPGIVPVLGQLDDLAAVLLALRFALRGLPGPAADAVLANAGLSRTLLARDLDNVRVTAAWTARGAARAGARAAAVVARGLAGATGLAARGARSGLRGIQRRQRTSG
jgi:uncharacterized membrane protein YkvA (DUF1232 family)